MLMYSYFRTQHAIYLFFHAVSFLNWLVANLLKHDPQKINIMEEVSGLLRKDLEDIYVS